MTDDDLTVYASLATAVDGNRWAFGTGFTDPLAGVDQTVPDGIDRAALAAYCVMLGDDALIYSHRLQQWMTRAPELEEEAAIANIALDLLGQARMLLARAGRADDSGRDEDDLAFLRAETEFRNVRLVERYDDDFAELVARLFVFSTWRLACFDRLRASRDPVLAAIAAKAVNELTYHRDYAAQWVVRLGDGTDVSHRRMQAALDRLWPLVPELFDTNDIEGSLPGVAVEAATLLDAVNDVLNAGFAAATVTRPTAGRLGRLGGKGGRDGMHTEAMGFVLAELQSVARAHPGATW